MGKIKKGALMSLSMALLIIALLFLLLSIALYNNSLRAVGTELSKFERVNMQFDTAAYGVKQIVSIDAVNVTAVGNNITFQENFSNMINYPIDLSRFKSFVEAYALVNVSINISEASLPVIYIQPQSIIVNHTLGRMSIIPQNTASSSGNVVGYNVLLIINQPTPRLNWTNLSSISQSNPNAMSLHVGLQGTDGTLTNTTYLNKSAYSELRLLNSQNQSIITIQINSPAALTINYNINMSTITRTTLLLNSSSNAELGRNIINVTQRREIEKIGQVIILEG